MIKLVIALIIFFSFLYYNTVYSQGEIVDDFSKKSLPDWIWGGVEMEYSHAEDNKENGFAEIFSLNSIKGRGYIGKVLLRRPYLFTAGNYVNVMIQGVNNDATVRIQLLYDIDNNSFFEEELDLMISSKPISMDFLGWKEIKLKLDQENFQISTKSNGNFEETEEEVFGFQLEFQAGKKYKESKFESGIALVSEIPNKEAFTDGEIGTSKEESYFNIRNFPNPFNPTTTITYVLPNSTNVSLTVYDRLGREVEVLVDRSQDAGEHSVEFYASEYPSGIYFYRIKTSEKTEVRKMLLTK